MEYRPRRPPRIFSALTGYFEFAYSHMEIILGSQKYIPQRIFCIGMNYTEHIKELNSRAPGRPVVFMKPATSLVPPGHEIIFPAHGQELHFETELVLLIGREGIVKNENDSLDFISGIGLGFDLTLRDLQRDLKKEGLPWEISKAFDNSAPIGNFVEYTSAIDIHNIEFSGYVNDTLRQNGNTSQMIYPVEKLVSYIGSIWSFLPGDLIFTGTPPGVGSLKKSDKLSLSSPLLPQTYSWEFEAQ